MKKRLLAVVLLITMLFNMESIAVAAEMAELATEEQPLEDAEVIEISSQKDLEQIANHLSGDYFLTDNIVLEGEWIPLGSEEEPFTGTLNGNGHIISGLNITGKDFEESAFMGLFGMIEEAKISNLAIENCNIKSGAAKEAHIGAIAGGMKNSQIEDIYVSGQISVEGNASYSVGGITGSILQTESDETPVLEYNAARRVGDVRINVPEDAEGEKGALAGYVDDSAVVEACYSLVSDENLFGVEAGGDNSCKILDETIWGEESSYLGFDFETIWKITEGGARLAAQNYDKAEEELEQENGDEGESLEMVDAPDAVLDSPEDIEKDLESENGEALDELPEEIEESDEGIALLSEDDLQYGDYTYRVSGNDAVITGYTGSGGSIVVPSKIGEYTVTGIGDQAFYGKSTITGITLPETIKTLDSRFIQGTGIKKIKIPKNVECCGVLDNSYGPLAGSSVTEVEFEEGMKKIPDYACAAGSRYSSYIEKVTIPESVTEIGSSVFYGCSELMGLELPERVTGLGSRFIEGTGIKKIKIPKNVENCYLGDDDSQEYNGLGPLAGSSVTEVEFEEGMKKIPDNACATRFYNSYLEKVVIPESVTEIGSCAFYNCEKIGSVNIPKGVSQIGASAFEGCKRLKKVALNYNDAMVNTINNETQPYSLTIGDFAFWGCAQLEEINLTENVTSIGDFAFSGCSELMGLELPERVETLGERFIQGTGIKKIRIPKNVENCRSWNMNGPLAESSVTEVEFEEGMKKIPDYACATDSYYSSYIEKVTIPESVTEIGSYAFYNCEKIGSVNIPKGVSQIGASAFEGCKGLKKVALNYNDAMVNTINNGTQPYSLEIGYNAFYNCEQLMEINLTENVTTIGWGAFYGCSKLMGLELPERVTNLGDEFIQGTGIKRIKIPKNVENCRSGYGDDGALAGSSVTEVEFEEGMKKIPSYACATSSNYSSYIEKVIIPESVSEIGNNAFLNCTNMKIYGIIDSYAHKYAKENNIPFVEYDGLNTGDIISDSYGVTENQRTRAGDVYHEAKCFTKAVNDYYAAATGNLKADAQKANASPQNFKQLRNYDETASSRKTNQLLTIDPNAPDEAIDDAYEVLYDFLKDCLQTGIDEKIIKLDIDTSQSIVKTEAKIVNKIFDAVRETSDSYRGTGSNGFVVELSKTGIFGQAFGGVTIGGGKGKYRGSTYWGTFCSDGKTVSAAMNQFIEDLSAEVKKLYKEAALSLWKDFMKKSQIASVTEDMLKMSLESKTDYLIQKGYGKLLASMLNIKKGYDLVEMISSTKTADAALKKIQSGDMKELYQSIKKLSYSDKELKNESMKTAMEQAESARKKLESALYDYLYNDDTYDSLNPGEKFQHFWKSVFQCPVDIEVYDGSGKLIGSVTDGAVTYDESIYIELNGDIKNVYVPKGKKVTYKLTGTGGGDMNCVLEEYQDGIATGRLNYYNVPLSKGICYSQQLEMEEMPKDTESIPLVQDTGDSINADEYISADNKEANVTIEGKADGGGVILGTGKYAKGDAVELTAVTDHGFRFDGWYEEDILVSYEANYRFTAISSQEVTAVFSKIPVKLNCPVTLSETYRDKAKVTLYETGENLAELVLSLYESETEEDISITVKKYIGKDKLVSSDRVIAECDGGFHFTVSDLALEGWNMLELLDDSGRQIGSIGNIPENKINVITASAGENGTISPSGEAPLKNGSSQAFVIKSKSGYEVEKVLVDGRDIGAVASYTFENVTEDHTIQAFFRKIQKADIKVREIILSKTEASVTIGTSFLLQADVVPENATNAKLQWRSTDSKLVSVNASGLVTAHKAGTATITVTAQDGSGVSANCKVTVRKQEEEEGSGNQEQPDVPASQGQQFIQKKGAMLTDTHTKAIYKVTKPGTVRGNFVIGAEIGYVKPIGKLESVTIQDKVVIKGIEYKITSITANAFKNNAQLSQVKIGSNVRAIGSNAFSNCKKLKNVEIGKKVTTINNKAFYKCIALKKIVIPAKVNKIGKQAFYGCKKLRNITIKTSKLTKKKIGSKAFKGIYAKASVKVPGKKLKSYRKLLRAKGMSKKARIKK